MRKLKALLLTLALALGVCAPVYAAEDYTEWDCAAEDAEGVCVSTEIEYLENGDYIETTITLLPSETGIAAYASSYSVTGTKTSTYVNSSGDKLWAVTVTADFTYVPGTSVSCTGAMGSTEVYSSNWKVGTATAEYVGNVAQATATGKRYFLFVVTDTVSLTVKLQCDKNGVLS